jgi:hypothetical protein
MVTTFRGSALKQILVYEDCISQPNWNVENPDNSDLLQLNQPARHKSSENDANKTQIVGLGIGSLHRGPGEINFPVCCGGIVVRPGDVTCGDANGVVVVPQEFLEEFVTRLEHNRQTMHDYEQNVKRGSFSNEWVDETLTKLDCFRVD